MPARKDRSTGSLFQPSASSQPLAARMRPKTLDEFVGQAAILGPGKPLRDSVERGTIGSLILWGPPGSGKTTLGHLVAHFTDREFVPFSAVTEGVLLALGVFVLFNLSLIIAGCLPTDLWWSFRAEKEGSRLNPAA